MATKIDVAHEPDPTLERIHDVAIAAIKGEVVPGPIGDGANALLATH